MFNIGGGELLVIMLIALIVLGPQRLPDAARQVGKTMSELRRLSTGFQNEMKSALDTPEAPAAPAAPTRKTPLVAEKVAPAKKPAPAKKTAPRRTKP